MTDLVGKNARGYNRRGDVVDGRVCAVFPSSIWIQHVDGGIHPCAPFRVRIMP